MSDYLAETPVLGRKWCPECQPEADPLGEILDVQRCGAHSDALQGPMTGPAYADTISGGDTNRVWCDFFHRQIPVRKVEYEPPFQPYVGETVADSCMG